MNLREQQATVRIIKAYCDVLKNKHLIPHDRQVYLNRIAALCKDLRQAAPNFLRSYWGA